MALTIGILRARNEIDTDKLGFFLTGPRSLANPHRNPAPEWLTDRSWNEIVCATDLSGLENLRESFVENIAKWKEFYDFSNPEEHSIPEPFENAQDFDRLILLKCVRPDKIVFAVKQFIVSHMNEEFIEPPPFDIKLAYDESNPVTPLIFVLSPGLNPVEIILSFAKECGMSEK